MLETSVKRLPRLDAVSNSTDKASLTAATSGEIVPAVLDG